MKIAVIAHSHYPIAQPFAGGLEAHTYYLTLLLQQADHDVTLFAAQRSDNKLFYKPFCRPSAPEHFKPIAKVNQYRETAYHNLISALKQGHFDVVHNNSLHYVPLYRVSELSIPMITVLHSPPFVPMLNGFRHAVQVPNHKTIAVSNTVARLWLKESLNCQSTVIYNGIDTKKWSPQSVEERDYIVWFGRITPEKGTHIAIEAAIKANTTLKLCGPITHKKYFEEKISYLLKKYSEQIHYLGNLNDDILSKIVAGAKVFLCTPCWDEPFGLVAVEALACGTPIAGIKRGALPEILNNKTSVLVQEDCNALADAIKKAETLSREACRDYAVNNFSIEKMISQYIDVYENTLNLSGCLPVVNHA
jgi:glycosyltransferase involved in cell wall biosynthesis